MAKKAEEVNIMDGIDFIKNQRRMKRIEDRLRKEKRKQNILLTLISIIIIFSCLIILKTMEKNAYKKCVESGIKKEICEVRTK